jgi:hypothetical protein
MAKNRSISTSSLSADASSIFLSKVINVDDLHKSLRHVAPSSPFVLRDIFASSLTAKVTCAAVRLLLGQGGYSH